MVVPNELAVWLDGAMVARISQERRRLRLQYTDDALAKYDLGIPLLSLSLPLTTERYTHVPVQAFLDGLLPEGEPRQVIAHDFGIRGDDTFELISALGRDCAGAVVIQPANDPGPRSPTTLTAESLSEQELADLVANLREAPLGAGGRVRLSLAGVQEKLILTRKPDGAWGRPLDGTPSTHIIKPEIARYLGTVENEAFCMRVARNLGLPVAHVDTMTVVNRKLIVVERFDRDVHPDGTVLRLHQDDFCQATATYPSQKYEEDGGPSLRRIAGILDTFGPRGSTEALLRAVTLNVLLGNGDAHAKNFSVLHDPIGQIRLAPLYDLMSTLFYGDNRLAMSIDSVQRMDRVTASRIVAEAEAWSIPRSRAADIVAEVVEGMPDALESAQDETPGLAEGIPRIIASQLKTVGLP